MRTRTGWLAWVLTAGMALVPATAWGQNRGDQSYNVPSADPVYPLPLGHDRMETGGFYLGAQYLMYHQTNPIQPQLIATRGLVDFDGSITAALSGQPITVAPFVIPGTPRPGTFIGSNRVALKADDVGDGNYGPGFSVFAGWRFQNGVAVELNWWYLFENKYSASASLVPPGFTPRPGVGLLLEETFLFALVFNFPIEYAGPSQKIALGNPGAAYGIWNGASLMQLEFVQRTQGLDLTFRIPLFQDDCTRCYALVGPRFVWFWERFKWRTVSYDFAGVAGPDDVAIYTNIVSNRMYGLSVGVGSDWLMVPKWGLAMGVDLRVAPLIDVVRERARYERGDKSITQKRARTEYEFVPEVQANINLTWYPIEGVQMRFGYDIMAFFNTIASQNPVTFSYGTMDPHWGSQTRILNGINAGISIIF